jgi:hypothetical protein
VRQSVNFLRKGVHLLLVDLFPSDRRHSGGVHKAIWNEVYGDREPFALPNNQPLALVSYCIDTKLCVHLEPVGVGDALPAMALFLKPDRYLSSPLEATYQKAWSVFPRALKGLLE